MTGEEHIERVVKTVNGAVKGSEDKFDEDYCLSILDSLRGGAIKEMMKVAKNIPYQWYQPFELFTDDAIQISTEYVSYYVNRILPLGNFVTSPLTLTGSNGEPIKIRTSIAKNKLFSRNLYLKNKKEDYALIVTGFGGKDEIRLYGKPKSKLVGQAVFAEPMKMDNFNLITDDYPITEDLIPMIDQQAISLHLRMAKAVASDYIANLREEVRMARAQEA